MDKYYTNLITDYLTNYDSAISKVDKIISSMDSLLTSFNTASGADIVAIRNDLNGLISSLEIIKETITKHKNNTNTNAINSDKVYNEVKLLPCTPTFKNRDYAFESTGQKRVYIENGIIYWEESFRKIPLSSYNGLFGGVAAVGKLLNSYQIIKNRTHADVDLMLKGITKMI